jgi:hypothetical protein
MARATHSGTGKAGKRIDDALSPVAKMAKQIRATPAKRSKLVGA